MPTYELDFYAWLNRQAQVLRSRESESLDWDHLAEEIEAMAAGEKRELTSHYCRLAFSFVCRTAQSQNHQARRTALLRYYPHRPQ